MEEKEGTKTEGVYAGLCTGNACLRGREHKNTSKKGKSSVFAKAQKRKKRVGWLTNPSAAF